MSKSKLLAAALLVTAGAANAGLSFVPTDLVSRTETFNNIVGLPDQAPGTVLSIGDLYSSEAGTITFTYLGQESLYLDQFHLLVNGTDLFESDAVGASKSAAIGSGFVNFSFEGDSGSFAINGGAKSPGTNIGNIGAGLTVTAGGGAGTYDFILGYNDSAGSTTLGDWDDFVVGVNFTPPVPEPETYALMLAGLGVMGFIARRRRAD